jgi:hypothetical protein
MRPSTPFTRTELRALAVAGMRDEVSRIEQRLARIHREFPEIFIGKTVPVLLKVEPRANGSAWPLDASPMSKVDAPSMTKLQAAWTPARRKAQSERMRERYRKRKRATRTDKRAQIREQESDESRTEK